MYLGSEFLIYIDTRVSIYLWDVRRRLGLDIGPALNPLTLYFFFYFFFFVDADSTTLTNRARLFVRKYMVMLSAGAGGPLVQLLMLQYLGDTWEVVTTRHVLLVGVWLLLPSLPLLWMFNDDLSTARGYQVMYLVLPE